MKKLLIVAILLTVANSWAYAQQDAMYSQYTFNALAINPAYAGSRNNVLNATALYRNQWTGIDGAPETQTLSFDMPVAYKRIGLGLQLFNDEIGITNTTGAFASYAYRINTGNGKLALGLQAGITSFRADFSSVELNTGSPFDPAFSENVNQILPNFGTGVYYRTDRFYVGASVPNLLNNALKNNSSAVNNGLSRQYVHLFIASGYVFDMGEDFKLKPSILFKGVRGTPLQLDVNAAVWIKDIFSIGASYRSNADISAMAEAQISWQMRIGYAYDRSITRLANFNSGSHEIMIKYQFAFDKDAYLEPKCYF